MADNTYSAINEHIALLSKRAPNEDATGTVLAILVLARAIMWLGLTLRDVIREESRRPR